MAATSNPNTKDRVATVATRPSVACQPTPTLTRHRSPATLRLRSGASVARPFAGQCDGAIRRAEHRARGKGCRRNRLSCSTIKPFTQKPKYMDRDRASVQLRDDRWPDLQVLTICGEVGCGKTS